MKNVSILFSLWCALFLISCGDDAIDPTVTGDLELNMKITYNGEPLVMGDRITYPGGNELVITRYSFFMMDGQMTADDEENGILNLADSYVNLTDAHGNAQSAAQGLTLLIEDIPAGSYETFSFNQGVNAEDNAKTPADFTEGPLTSTNEFWNAWNSYVFVKMEGNYDVDGDGEPEEGIAFHLGGDEAFRTVTIGSEGSELVEIEEDEVASLSLEIKLEELFTQNGTTFDIASTPRTHMPATQEQINFLATGAMNAIDVEDE